MWTRSQDSKSLRMSLSCRSYLDWRRYGEDQENCQWKLTNLYGFAGTVIIPARESTPWGSIWTCIQRERTMYEDNFDNNNFTYDHMCERCQRLIKMFIHWCSPTECCHRKSLWGTENETFSQFTPEMLRMIERDTTDADIQSEKDLLPDDEFKPQDLLE